MSKQSDYHAWYHALSRHARQAHFIYIYTLTYFFELKLADYALAASSSDALFIPSLLFEFNWRIMLSPRHQTHYIMPLVFLS